MKFREYIEKNGFMKKFVAEKIGVSQSTLMVILRNTTDIHLSLAVRIVKFTHGHVTYEDLNTREKYTKAKRKVDKKEENPKTQLTESETYMRQN